MSSRLQLRRGTNAANAAFTGAEGEVIYNTTTKGLVAHDGATIGGFPVVMADELEASEGASLVGYLPAGEDAVATTVETKLRETISVKDFGAIGDGVADDTAAIQVAISNISDGVLIIPPGEYKITGDLIIQLKNNQSGVGPAGALRIVADGACFTDSGRIIIDSCKRLTITGLDAPNHDLVLRGCWWSNFEGMRFKVLFFSGAGTQFSSNFWNQWTNCQFQSIKTSDTSTYNNKMDWFACSMRGNANQGFSGTQNYAFEFNGNVPCQAWCYWGGDISYYNTAIYNVGDLNTAGDIELAFNGTYFDTLLPVPINRARSRIQTKNCHYANNDINHPNAAVLQAVARGGQDFFRQDRAAGWAQFSGINFIPNGDFRVGLPTYAGAGLPIGASGGATITATSGGIFGRYLNINQAATSGTTRFRPRELPFTGRYTAVVVLRNADVGTRTIRLGFNNLYEVAEINNTEWTLWTLTGGVDIAAGQQPDIQILTNNATAFNVDVCYAAVTFGEGGMPMTLASPFVELIGSASYNPPSLLNDAGASTTITVTGAALGDFAIPSFGIDLQGIQMWAQVTATDTVTVFFRNETGGTIDLASSTLRARVVKAQY